MNGKIVLCFAAVLVTQTMSASVFDGEELKKISEQLGQSALSITSHLNQRLGFPSSNIAEAQTKYKKVAEFVIKGISDLDVEAGKLSEIVRKNTDRNVLEKVDELKKEIKKHTADAKTFFDEKVKRPIDDNIYKDDIKKISDSILMSTKKFEEIVNKFIDGPKLP